MNPEIALLLLQDGLVTGSTYALLALAAVLLFTTTRIIFVPQGDLVALSGLTYASWEVGKLPASVWLLAGLAGLATLIEIIAATRSRRFRALPRALFTHAILPGLIVVLAVCVSARPPPLPLIARVLLTVALIVPLGPLVYRVAFQPVIAASISSLFVVAIATHFAIEGIALIAFGPEGVRAAPLLDASMTLGPLSVSAQSLLMIGVTAASAAALYLFFRLHMLGKALRAVAVNRLGARLVGIGAERSGAVAFLLSAAMAAFTGVLLAGSTTLYYDSGFMIGLKAFVGALFGGLISYPAAVVGAFLIGVLESFVSFWASAYKDALVFAALIPIMWWLSVRGHTEGIDDDEDSTL
jgi:branched-chain amino acid transport system permease protein